MNAPLHLRIESLAGLDAARISGTKRIVAAEMVAVHREQTVLRVAIRAARVEHNIARAIQHLPDQPLHS